MFDENLSLESLLFRLFQLGLDNPHWINTRFLSFESIYIIVVNLIPSEALITIPEQISCQIILFSFILSIVFHIG